MAYLQLGQFQKAGDDFSKCVALYPDSTPQAAISRFHLAKSYAALKEKAKAIECLKQVLDICDQTGCLSSREITEAKSLLKQLQEGI